RPGCHRVGRACATRATRIRREQRTSNARGVGPAIPTGTPDRQYGRPRTLKSRDRPETLPLAQDGLLTPVSSLPEARHLLASPVGRGVRHSIELLAGTGLR